MVLLMSPVCVLRHFSLILVAYLSACVPISDLPLRFGVAVVGGCVILLGTGWTPSCAVFSVATRLFITRSYTDRDGVVYLANST